MSKKRENINKLALKFARSQSRAAEIAAHGKPLKHTNIQQSKKNYNRKKIKEEDL